MSMIQLLDAAIARYDQRIEEVVARVTDADWGDHNPGAIAGLYADRVAMVTDAYQRRQHEERLRQVREDDTDNSITENDRG